MQKIQAGGDSSGSVKPIQRLIFADNKETNIFSGADKHELKNVKQLCLTVLKGQRRLAKEVGRVKENVQRHSVLLQDESDSKEDSSVLSIKHVQEIVENQKRNLKAHLIALDMKEQGKLFPTQV